MRRQEIASELKRYFAEADANLRPAPEVEINDLIAEAIRSTRPSYRPR